MSSRPAVHRLAAGAKQAIRRTGVRRSHLAALRMCCERNTLALVGRGSSAPHGRILCYHSVGTPEWGVNDVSPRQFARHIEVALAAGYRFVPAEEIAAGRGGPKDLAMTFDDGLASTLNALPILGAYHVPWTLFVVSEWAEGRSPWGADLFLGWRGVEQCLTAGAAIGSHSVSHPNFGLLTADEAREELVRSRAAIAGRLGAAPASFAIPLGQSGNWSGAAMAEARAAGYKVVYAQSVTDRPAGTVPRTFITRWDTDRVFQAALAGRYDGWEEWV